MDFISKKLKEICYNPARGRVIMGPVAHCSLGFLGWKLSKSSDNKKTGLLFLFVANLPDIDFLFQILLKNQRPIHQLYTHNFIFIILAIFLIVFLGKQDKDLWIYLLLTGVSHLILDLIVLDRIKPIGIRIFFPFIDQYYNLGCFPPLTRGGLKEVLSLQNLFVFTLECVIFVTITQIILKIRESRRKKIE